MTERAEPGAAGRLAPQANKRRLDRRTVRLLAWGVGAISFALPWAAFQTIARPATTTSAAQQIVTVPPGSRVTFTKSAAGVVTGVTVVTPKTGAGASAGPATAPVTTTGGSVPPP